jgi:hypothetical protein
VRDAVLVMLVTACAAGNQAPENADTIVAPGPDRPVCGWKARIGATEIIEIDSAGRVSGPPPGRAVLALVAAPATPFERVRRVLEAHSPHLVRLEVVVDGRWLVPMTFAGRPAPPLEGETVEAIVGHRRIIRPKTAPRVRFADIRVDPVGVRIFVENERVGGSAVELDELAGWLRELDPPATAFALTATGDTPWSRFVRTLVVAACFDRAPGAEPHEVLLDERPPPVGSRGSNVDGTENDFALFARHEGNTPQKPFTAPAFVP